MTWARKIRRLAARSWGWFRERNNREYVLLLLTAAGTIVNAALWITTRDGTYRVQRAYVLPHEYRFDREPLVADQHIHVIVSVKNVGPTPARNVCIRAWTEVQSRADQVDNPHGLNLDVLGEDWYSGAIGFLGPESIGSVEVEKRPRFLASVPLLTKEEYERIHNPPQDKMVEALMDDRLMPGHVLRITGRIDYHDVFNKEGSTDFCADYVPKGPHPSTIAHWAPCPFNEIR